MFKGIERFKNIGLWLSIIAYIFQVLVSNSIVNIDITPQTKSVIDAVVYILVTLGILNNPTTKNKFYGDDNVK